jgi:hypothetical protein
MAQVRAADRAGAGDFKFGPALAAAFAGEFLVCHARVARPRGDLRAVATALVPGLGFYSSQFIGRCALAVFFIFILTPLGWVLRLMGKDPLQLKRPHNAATYWHQARDGNPLDRLF